MSLDEEEQRQHEIRVKNQELAEAKGRRVYFEHYRKVHKAILMKQYESKHPTAAAQEREAYADPAYLETLAQLEHWTARAELLTLEHQSLIMKFEAWRTRQANARSERHRYGA